MKFKNSLFVSFVIVAFWFCSTNSAHGTNYADTTSYQILKVEIDYIWEEINYRGPMYSAWMVPVNENTAIAQFGRVDIVSVDINTGEVLRRIDLEVLSDEIEPVMREILGESYYIPDQEEYLRKSRYASHMALDFHYVINWAEKERYATLVRTIVFNELDEEDYRLVDFILLFDEKMDDFEVLCIDPETKSPFYGLFTGGFFLGTDRLFTMINPRNEESFDFLEFQLVESNCFVLVDTLENIKAARVPYFTFYSTFSLQGENYFNLGSHLLSFQGSAIREGDFHQFPVDSTLYCVDIQGFDSDDYAVGFFVNDFSDEVDPIGELMLFNGDLELVKVLDSFDLTELHLFSLFTVGSSVYVNVSELSNDRFILLKYTDIM